MEPNDKGIPKFVGITKFDLQASRNQGWGWGWG